MPLFTDIQQLRNSQNSDIVYCQCCFFTAEIEIGDCDSDTTVVEGRYQSFQCNGNDVPTSTFHWTLVNESGSTLPLATCYGRYNCSLTPVAQTTFPDLSAYQYNKHNCKLHAYPVSQGFSGRLICNQTLDNSMVQSASCRINIVREYFKCPSSNKTGC